MGLPPVIKEFLNVRYTTFSYSINVSSMLSYLIGLSTGTRHRTLVYALLLIKILLMIRELYLLLLLLWHSEWLVGRVHVWMESGLLLREQSERRVCSHLL